ncbi:MAG: hypothetical protein U0325_10140 [Polyangiales bacterium]
MIGPKSSIPEARWREKLSPPRPLREGEGFLYGPPSRAGAAAFLAWIFDPDPDAALRRAWALARADGAGALYAGGPPGNYLVDGVDASTGSMAPRARLRRARRHVDLCVDPRRADPRARARRAPTTPPAASRS